MNITIITIDTFPYGGGASSNRIISYAKELVKIGTNIHVHCLQPYIRPNDLKDQNIKKPLVKGVFEGISYQYTAGTIEWPNTGEKKILKLFLRIKSYAYSFVEIFRNRKSTDIVHIYTNRVFLFYYYWLICKVLGIKFTIERNEYPPIEKQKEYYNKTIARRIYSSLVILSFKLFDGWMIETSQIADYYISKAKKSTKYCLIPMTVEHERFTSLERTASPYGRYIAYCGNMQEIDGISILIEAFSIVHKQFPDVKLVLAGESEDIPQQKILAKQLSIEDDVIFLGRLHRDSVPQFLKNATILALASPTSLRACASMPCKVGEYLCTGNPVVVTSLGEIPKYLTDGENAFLAEADSAQKFADKLKHALSLSDVQREKIGLSGQQVAIEHFGSAKQALKLNSFFSSLIR